MKVPIEWPERRRTGPPGRSAGLLSRIAIGMAVILSSTSLLAAEVHAAEVAQGDVGKAGYEAYCQSCHQADGKGMTGAFPPLAGSDYLLEDPERGILAVLRGISGSIMVNGVSRTPNAASCMPPSSLGREKGKIG